MKMTIIGVLVGAIATLILTLSGCTSTQAIRTMQATDALLELRASYDAASLALMEEAQNLPDNERVRLLALKMRADKLVLEITQAWTQDRKMAFAELGGWVSEARSIYTEGKALIAPRIQDFDAATIVRLGELDRNMRKIDSALQDLKQTNTGAYLELLMQAATTAVRIAAIRG